MQTSSKKQGGKLCLTVREAALKHDTEVFAKMDPYCVVKCGGITKKTRVKESAGKYPKWHDVF